MEARAVSKYNRISPRKARLVADLVRGKNLDQALSILALTPKKASPILRKTILSAAANVRQMDAGDVEMDDTALFVKEIRIDEGPTMKRIQARAQSSLEPYRETLEAWHTEGIQGTTIHQALQWTFGYTGSYSSVRRFVQGLERPQPYESACPYSIDQTVF